MERFNPEKELAKVQNRSQSSFNSSKLSNMFIPVFIIACSALSIVGLAFSANLAERPKGPSYNVKVNIVGKNNTSYERNVLEGEFSASLFDKPEYGTLECSSGTLYYDSSTSTIYNNYLNENVNCTLTLTDNILDSIDVSNLPTINDNTGVSYYYKGNSHNNYILVNDMLFRILRINGDGTLRIMLDEVVLSSPYGSFNEYDKSNLKVTLDKWFKEKFNNEEYLIEEDFDDGNYYDYEVMDLIDYDSYYYGYVGTVSVREAALISEGVTSNYLNTINGFYLMNSNGTDNAYGFKGGKVISVNASTRLSVRPVINIKVAKLSGSGSSSDPYKIEG